MTANNGPRISVIVPCHNDGEFLTLALDSLGGESGLEIVVVDDQSSDPATLALLDDLPAGVALARHEVNQGLAAARNTGLEATSAPYIFPLDADDLIQPGALDHMAGLLDTHPEASACFGDYVEFGQNSRMCRVPDQLDAYRLAYRNEFPVTALFRRTALEEVGGWEDVGQWAGYEDWDLWLKLVESGHEGVHAGPGFITYRRLIRGGSMLSTSRNHHRGLYAALRKRHPKVFGSIGEHRRRSTLGPAAKLAYPVLYGARPRSRFEREVKNRLIGVRERLRGS